MFINTTDTQQELLPSNIIFHVSAQKLLHTTSKHQIISKLFFQPPAIPSSKNVTNLASTGVSIAEDPV